MLDKQGRQPRLKQGIYGPPGPRTDRSDLVLDFLNFVGPVRSEIFQILLVLVRSGFGPWIPDSNSKTLILISFEFIKYL